MSSGSKVTETLPKLCHDRVALVEKHYGQLCQTFGSITNKIARMRDKGDKLAEQVNDLASDDKVSQNMSNNLKSFAVNLSGIQDYRNAEISRLKNKVVEPLSGYGSKCKKIKGIIKKEQAGIKKEEKLRKKLEKVRQKSPSDAHSIATTQTELQKASSHTSIGMEALNNQIAAFEKEKLTDLKKILLDFVSVELVFHAKAIEHYSRCFENLAVIDEDMDLDEFKRKLSIVKYHQMPPPQDTQEVPMATASSLGTTATSSAFASSGDYTTTEGSYTYGTGTSSMSASGERRVRIQTQSMYGNEEDDEEEEEDSEEDSDDDGDYSTRR